GTASAAATLHGTWQKLPAAPVRQVQGSMVSAWTGREMIIHGNATTFAYNPATNTWRKIPSAPLEKRASAKGAWTGRELVVAGGITDDPTFKVFRDAAA